MFKKLLIFILLLAVTERACHYATEGFRTHKIASDLPFNSAYESSFSEEQLNDIKKILNQPFTFLGSGGQCYAFLSQDKTTVIKFFKHHHMRPEIWLDKIPLPAFLDKPRRALQKTRQNRHAKIFTSCKIAYEILKEETGTLYIHLNKTDLFHKKLMLIDKIGIAHTIDPDQTEFVLQKRATLFYAQIKKFMKADKTNEAKACIDSLLELIVSRCQKGIADTDPILKRNCGSIGTQAMTIDLGSFVANPHLQKPSQMKKTLLFETERLKKWLLKQEPELVPYFQSKLDAHLNS